MAEQKLMRMKKAELVDAILGLQEEKDSQFCALFGLLDDYGYCPTSEGQIVSFVKEIIEENEKLKEENKKLLIFFTGQKII